MLDVDRDRAGRGPDHEERRDREHVDEDDVLQPQRVGGLERDEARARQASDAGPSAAASASASERRAPRRARAPCAGRELAARDRARARLTGCSRSAATSRRSLTR